MMWGWGSRNPSFESGLWREQAGTGRFLSTASPGAWPCPSRSSDQWSASLQFLGRYETVMFYWPSLLCLSFLLGRFLYMFVKSLRVHLGWELQTVSTKYKHCTRPDRFGLHNSACGRCYYSSPHSLVGNLDPGKYIVLPRITYPVCGGARKGTQTVWLWRLCLNHCSCSGSFRYKVRLFI